MKHTGVRKKIGKVVLLSIVGLISYSAFLIVNIPAEKLWQYLPTEQLPIQPTGITGTPWSGAAESVTLTISRQPLELPSIRWQVEPGSLLQGNLKIDVELGNMASVIEGKGTIILNQNAVKLENIKLDSTAQWLVSATRGQIPGDLMGNVGLQLDDLTFNNKGCTQLTGNAELTNSQLISDFGPFDLGNSTAELSCQNQKLIARINQKSSMLSSYGEFQMGANGRYTFTGKTTPDASLPEFITKGLSLLGKPDSSGNYSLSFRNSAG